MMPRHGWTDGGDVAASLTAFSDAESVHDGFSTPQWYHCTRRSEAQIMRAMEADAREAREGEVVPGFYFRRGPPDPVAPDSATVYRK